MNNFQNFPMENPENIGLSNRNTEARFNVDMSNANEIRNVFGSPYASPAEPTGQLVFENPFPNSSNFGLSDLFPSINQQFGNDFQQFGNEFSSQLPQFPEQGLVPQFTNSESFSIPGLGQSQANGFGYGEVSGFGSPTQFLGDSSSMMGLPSQMQFIGELPSASQFGLPSPTQILSDLPSPSMLGLPSPTQVLSDLPSPAMMGLPSPTQILGDLPSPSQLGLPSPTQFLSDLPSPSSLGLPNPFDNNNMMNTQPAEQASNTSRPSNNPLSDLTNPIKGLSDLFGGLF